MAMHFKDQRKKARRAETRSLRTPAKPRPRIIDTGEKHRYVRRETGLQLLFNSGKLDAAQRAAGDRYGVIFRTAALEDASLLKSGIDFSSGGAKGGTKTFPGQIDYQAAEDALRARNSLAKARNALSNHSGLVAVLDVICGKQWTPAQVTQVRREQEEIATGLRIALDLLIKHFKEVDEGNAAARP